MEGGWGEEQKWSYLAQWFQGSWSPCSEVGERKKLGSAHGSPYKVGNKFDNRDFHPKVRDVHEMWLQWYVSNWSFAGAGGGDILFDDFHGVYSLIMADSKLPASKIPEHFTVGSQSCLSSAHHWVWGIRWVSIRGLTAEVGVGAAWGCGWACTSCCTTRGVP